MTLVLISADPALLESSGSSTVYVFADVGIGSTDAGQARQGGWTSVCKKKTSEPPVEINLSYLKIKPLLAKQVGDRGSSSDGTPSSNNMIELKVSDSESSE